VDPVANMEEQIELANAILERDDTVMFADTKLLNAYDAARLAELVVALDEWHRRR
jgi:hypothetical protein